MIHWDKYQNRGLHNRFVGDALIIDKWLISSCCLICCSCVQNRELHFCNSENNSTSRTSVSHLRHACHKELVSYFKLDCLVPNSRTELPTSELVVRTFAFLWPNKVRTWKIKISRTTNVKMSIAPVAFCLEKELLSTCQVCRTLLYKQAFARA